MFWVANSTEDCDQLAVERPIGKLLSRDIQAPSQSIISASRTENNDADAMFSVFTRHFETIHNFLFHSIIKRAVRVRGELQKNSYQNDVIIIMRCICSKSCLFLTHLSLKSDSSNFLANLCLFLVFPQNFSSNSHSDNPKVDFLHIF